MSLLVLLLLTPGCPPAAAPSGPLAEQLRVALERRGVGAPAADCEAVAVQVAAQGDAIVLTRAARPAQTVPDLDTAALLVETWVRADLIDPLLAARRGPPPPPPPPTAAPIRRRSLAFQAGLAGGGASDRSQWLGVEGQGCIELGPTCAGLTARILIDGGATGESKDSNVWRLGISLLANAEFDPGLVRLGVGAGVTSVRIDSKDTKDDDVRGAPLFEGRVARGFELADDLALDVAVAGTFALWPRKGRRNSGEEDFAGLPVAMGLASVGVRWSMW